MIFFGFFKNAIWALTSGGFRIVSHTLVNNELHSLHHLLPAKRYTQLISRLRSTMIYPTFRLRTNLFKNAFLLPV